VSRLLTRIRNLEAQAGQREQAVHAITLHEGEGEEDGKVRFLQEHPGTQLRETDLIIYIVPVPGCPEIERRGKGHSP
jgi:hypothetical protein